MCATVLIVEDDHSMAQLLKERFADEGYHVQVACTAAAAAKLLSQSLPDLITLDICLPDVDGLQLLKDIKGNPSTKNIPVIAVSSSDEWRRAQDLGGAAFFSKPVNFKLLLHLAECLAGTAPGRHVSGAAKNAEKTCPLCL